MLPHIPGYSLSSEQTSLAAIVLKLRCNASERLLSFHSIKTEMGVSEVGSLSAPVKKIIEDMGTQVQVIL